MSLPGPTGQSSSGREALNVAVRVGPSLLGSGYLLTRDRGHGEDLLQTTLWRVATRWETIESAPDAYAHKVLVNLSRDRRRNLARRPAELPVGEPHETAVEDSAHRLAEREVMTRAVQRLPRRQREVIVLRFFIDLSVAEAAAALGITEGTVKSHTARALAQLRAHLTPRQDAHRQVNSGGPEC